MTDHANVKLEAEAMTIPNKAAARPATETPGRRRRPSPSIRLRPACLLAPCLPALVWTIRGQIPLAFPVMTALAGVIGLDAPYRIERGGARVTETYDGFLMAIN